MRWPKYFYRQSRHTGEREAQRVQDPLESARSGRNPDRTARDMDLAERLILVLPSPIGRRDSPPRIVRRRTHDFYRVPARRKPFAHFSSVFGDSNEIGTIENRVDENLHG